MPAPDDDLGLGDAAEAVLNAPFEFADEVWGLVSDAAIGALEAPFNWADDVIAGFTEAVEEGLS